MSTAGFTEKEMAEKTSDLISSLAGKGPVPLEAPQSPVSSPLRGWYDGKPVYLRQEPKLVSDGSKTIRRWQFSKYTVTIVSDFSETPRRTTRSIQVEKEDEAGDECTVAGR